MTIARSAVKRVTALHQIRRLHGSTQPQLIRCSDQALYVVKFQNNPQGRRVLANELLGSLLAKALALPVPEPAIVHAPLSLILSDNELMIERQSGRELCRAGLCFGSLCVSMEPSLPFPLCKYSVLNVSDFLGALVFDKWTCNVDARQALFVPELGTRQRRAWMIDQGLCFNGRQWNFPPSLRKGIFYPLDVYRAVSGIDSFDPWLEKLEHEVNEDVLGALAREVPIEWYGASFKPLLQMIERLDARRRDVPDLIIAEWKSLPDLFPHWRQRYSVTAA